MTDCNYKKIFIDTSPFIYYLENHPDYFKRMYKFFTMCHNNGIQLVTSAVTIEEYCVAHYKNGKLDMVENFERFLDYMNIEVLSIDKAIAKQGSQIRAAYQHFKGMDALQIATAVCSNCDAFLTNDKQLRQEKEMPCITMDDLE